MADPHPLFRDALGRTIAAHPRLELRACDAHLPEPDSLDVLVVDSELLEDGHAWEPPPAVLAVAERIDADRLYAALAAGVLGYMSKDATGEALCRAIVAVARGETALDADARSAMAGEVRLRTRDERPLLSPREHEVLRLIAEGETAPQIAARLHLSTATVKTHMLHIYEKLGVGERAAAVASAMRWGLIE